MSSILSSETRELARIPITKVYQYDKVGNQFVEIETNLPGVYHQTKGDHVSWGNYNQDGKLDILLTGRDFFNNPLTKVYRYRNDNGKDTFVDAVFPPLPSDPKDTRLATFEYELKDLPTLEQRPGNYVLKGTAYDHEVASEEIHLIPKSGEVVEKVGNFIVLAGSQLDNSQNHQLLDWTKQLGTSQKDNASDLAVDSQGNIYTVGLTGGNLAQGEAITGYIGAWIAKYTPKGNLIWIQQIDNNVSDKVKITVDDKDNIYLTGKTYSNLGNNQAGGLDIWVSKYNSAGSQIWIKQLGTTTSDYSREITTDKQGNIYLTGYTDGNLAGSNGGYNDAWLAKYSGFI